MGFNLNNKNTYWFVDKTYGYDFMVNQDQFNNPNKPQAYGDAIGTNFEAYMVYNHKPFIDAVKACFVEKIDKKGKKYLQGYRHPSCFNLEYNTMSRDHILYALIFMKIAGETEFLKKMSKMIRWKISDKYSFTIESWLYMKGIGDNKLYNRLMMFFYYLIETPMSLFYLIWNFAIKKLGGFKKEVNQNDFVLIPNEQISKRKLKYRKLIYPIYALYEKGFTLYVSKNSLGKWIIKKISLFTTDKENYLLRILFGGKVSESKIYSYKPMYGGRWSTSLSELNDRYLAIITEPKLIEENNLDKDLLISMYKKIKK